MKRILVGIDGSESATRAVDHSAKLAAKNDADLILITVSNLPFILDEELKTYARAEHFLKEELPRFLIDPRPPALESARVRALAMGAPRIETVATGGDPATEIVAAADRTESDLIVVGRRGTGRLLGLIIGSVSQKVVQHANRPVMVVP